MRIMFLILLGLLLAAAPNGGTVSCPGSGNKAVSATVLQTSIYTILAPTGNSGTIYLGNSSVTTTGFPLVAGASYNAPPKSNSQSYDLSTVYFACSNSADTIKYFIP